MQTNNIHLFQKIKKIKNQNSNSAIKEMKNERKASKKLTYIITHKKVIGVRSIPSYPKQLNQIIELTMNIAAHSHGTFHRLYIPLLHQNRSGLVTQRLHLSLRQRLALHQMLDLTVQIRVRRHRFYNTPAPSDPQHKDRRFRRSMTASGTQRRPMNSVRETDPRARV